MAGICAKGKAPDDRAHEIADHLIGTCLDWNAEITEDEFDDTQLLSELDELVFQCEGCGWNCSTDELNDGQLCNDCNEKDCDDAE